LGAIDVAGEKILGIIMSAGYWIVLVAGSGKVISAIAKKDAESALKTSFGYGVAFASLYLLKWTLNLIKDVFK
jgi:hypothetical protein